MDDTSKRCGFFVMLLLRPRQNRAYAVRVIFYDLLARQGPGGRSDVGGHEDEGRPTTTIIMVVHPWTSGRSTTATPTTSDPNNIDPQRPPVRLQQRQGAITLSQPWDQQQQKGRQRRKRKGKGKGK
jgi:hypothetical protein